MSVIPFNTIFANGNPFLEKLGVEVTQFENGKAEIQLLIRDDLMNSWHTLQGGVSMTMMDVAMGLAARSMNENAVSAVTVDMQTQFLRPSGNAGEIVTAKACVTHRTAQLFFCESALYNGSNMVAKSTALFKTIHQTTVKKSV